MTVEWVRAQQGRYADSVTLMQISRDVSSAHGVRAALVAMSTPLNLELLAGMGFTVEPAASANDLVIAIRADDDDCLQAATGLADALLSTPRPRGNNRPEAAAPRTIGSAARQGAGLALISVPGQHAFTEAMDALDAGCDVLLFSDNVDVEQEIALKDRAAETGLLVMGPDCGTAVVGGVGLGFSHTLDRGPVGVIAASGTGAQQVLCLLDAAGVGVSAALGVGGRDLSSAVAGRSTRTALRLLDADPDTALIVLVSKPPADEVAADLLRIAAQLTTPVQFAMLGEGRPDLTAATEQALTALGQPVPDWPSWLANDAPPPRPGGRLVGLFCGGTLCDEAMLIAGAALGPVRSNIPLRPDAALDVALGATDLSAAVDGSAGLGHTMIDFGDDALTQGRAHPMIDPSLRNRLLAAALTAADTGVVLLDVVLGHGAHADPASELGALIEGAEVPVVVSLIGARRDPQSPSAVAAVLHAAGASVFTSNAAATRHAVALLQGGAPR